MTHTLPFGRLLFALCLFAALAHLPAHSYAQAGSAKMAEKVDHEELFKALATATTAQQARQIESAIWESWFADAPTLEARQLLDAGITRREAYDYEAAEGLFDQLIEMAPDYIEGYNQRAFIRFLRENLSGSLTDLERVIASDPRHFGALSGMYHVLRSQGRHQTAMQVLRQAVEVHPWINEHAALPEEMWPDNYRRIRQPGLKL